MAEGTRLLPGPLTLLGYAGVTPDVLINVTVFSQPARWVMVQNLTNQLLVYSWDGIGDHFVLPPCSDLVIDVSTNRGTPQTIAMPQEYGVWVRPFNTLPTSGTIFVSYLYAA